MTERYNERLTVIPDKIDILSNMGCRSGETLYDSVSKEFDTLFARIRSALDIRRSICIEDDRIYVTLSAGEKISALSEELFSRGEGIGGLIVNTAADCALFKADELTGERVKYICAELDRGVRKRLAAPEDIALAEQAVILKKAPLEGVTLTEGFMLSPVKSMCYILELTNDADVFRAQHDCSKCSNRDCPRRTSPFKGGFAVISDFGYDAKKACGVCLDIGTTTIAAVRLENGSVTAAHSEINRQRRFGADVLSRIEAANRGRGDELRSIMEYQLKSCINAVEGENERIIAAANTTMVSLLMGYDCTSLGTYPFRAQNLDKCICGDIELIGGISAFVGGDIVSGLYMCGFDMSSDICLFVDLGTNGEMAIGNKNGILCTSAAAGPAFEGGRLSCGTGSVEGAVSAVDIDKSGRIGIKTIGGKKACGLCGTGVVELTAELLKNGYIDSTGRMEDRLSGVFRLTDEVYFTQKDLREIQTAKGAIRAGIELLIAESGVSESDIKTVYIAGGFGQRLNIVKACRIGLLPERFMGRYRAVGNSSLGGCVKILDNDDGFERTELIRSISNDFALAENEKFTDEYIKYMDFPDHRSN